MISGLAFVVALPTLYALTAWALTGYDTIPCRPLHPAGLVLAVTGAVLVAAGAPFAYAS